MDKPSHFDLMLNCMGLACPIPVNKTRLKLNQLIKGDIVKVISDDPSSEIDFKAMVHDTGHELLYYEKNEDKFEFYIKKV